jgi:EpsI family protein
MNSRREFLFGAGCLAAAGSAYAVTPRERMSLLGKQILEKILPASFAGWNEVPSDALVVPQSEDSLAAKLYTQSLGRIYQRADGKGVMMLIAYGDTQSDSLQLHRPEVCYPAFGFEILHSASVPINAGHGVAIPGRVLTAKSPVRTEHISYWTRIGEFLPQDGNDQRVAKLKCAFQGLIPDGVLVRISSVEAEPANGFALNEQFAADMLQACVAPGRPALIGTAFAKTFVA